MEVSAITTSSQSKFGRFDLASREVNLCYLKDNRCRISTCFGGNPRWKKKKPEIRFALKPLQSEAVREETRSVSRRRSQSVRFFF